MMKQILSICLMICTLNSYAQVEFGIKGGLNSIDLVANSIQINDEVQSFDISFRESKYGHHFGIYSRLKLVGIYLEPAVIFNSNKVSYTIDEYSEAGVVSSIRNETYRNLDVPLMIGVKAGVIRLYGGPVAHIYVGNTSDLWKINGYGQKFKDATYGYQAGFGLDLWKLRFDVAYEGNLSKFGSHINVGGTAYSFSESASRIIGSVGYAF